LIIANAASYIAENKFPVKVLREFSLKTFILLTFLANKRQKPGSNQKISRFDGKSREASKFHDLPPQSLGDRFGPRFGIELSEERFDVEFDGMRGNAEVPGGGLVAQAIAERGKHLDFAGCQQHRRLLGPRAEASIVVAREPHRQPGGDSAKRGIDLGAGGFGREQSSELSLYRAERNRWSWYPPIGCAVGQDHVRRRGWLHELVAARGDERRQPAASGRI
jgi:hypothetical protein